MSLFPVYTAEKLYSITNSCVFNGTDEELTRVWSASPTDANIFTLSLWLKRGAIGSPLNAILGITPISARNGDIWFDTSNKISAYSDNAAAGHNRRSTATYTDTTNWHHWVFSMVENTTEGWEIFYDGTEITAWDSDTSTAGSNHAFNNASATHRLGRVVDQIGYWNGKMAEVVFIDGLSLNPDSFATGGKPIDVSGLTFGDDGFHLDFEDSANMGADVSGKGNTWTLVNMDSSNQSTDVP